MRLLLLLLLVVVVGVCEGVGVGVDVGVTPPKVFTKCSLAKELEDVHKMTREEIKKWVCIAQYESTFNTSAINHFNWDSSQDYGLFQVNNKYWCEDAHQGSNVCRMPCSALLDGDLTDDIQCIRKIVRDTERFKGKGKGLTAWVAYVNRCQNRDLDAYMSECWSPNTISNSINTKNDLNQDQDPLTPADTNILPPLPMPTIINNARVPIRFNSNDDNNNNKVVSNMHPTNYYTNPFANHFFIPPRPYSSFFYRGH